MITESLPYTLGFCLECVAKKMCEMRRASGVEVNEIMIPDSHQYLLMIVLVKDGFKVKLCNTHCFFTVKTVLIGYRPQNYVHIQ